MLGCVSASESGRDGRGASPGHGQRGRSNVPDGVSRQKVVTCTCEVISKFRRGKLASTWQIQIVDEDIHVRARIAVWCLKQVSKFVVLRVCGNEPLEFIGTDGNVCT